MIRGTMWQFLLSPMESRDAPPLGRHSTALDKTLDDAGKDVVFST